MKKIIQRSYLMALLCGCIVLLSDISSLGHGTLVYPMSRVYRVYESNPENPAFELARDAIAIDGTGSYYSWNEVSRNIPEAVRAGLPPGYDYSPWAPDGQLASGGRIDREDFARTYRGLDQVSPQWPATSVAAGETIEVDFFATAPHDPSVWDVWMTTNDWRPDLALTWDRMEYLGRPEVRFSENHYYFDLEIPAGRSGRQVLWVAWQRDDPVGEVFFSASDLLVSSAEGSGLFIRADSNSDGTLDISDPVRTLEALFVDGVRPLCLKSHDSNDDGVVDLSDAVFSLFFLFQGGAAPGTPFPSCGEDPSEDGLPECESSADSC
tara:strand:- start:247 stop:1215 length:969 start_codon:yes stop_codon:yes gene_type:complete